MNVGRLAIALGAGLVCSSGAFAQALCTGNPPPCPGGHPICVPDNLKNPNGPGHWQCQPNPLPPPLTDLSQAWTQINNVAYEFVVDRTSFHVMMVFFHIGGSSGSGWIDLGAPPSSKGDGATTGPAATSAPGTGFIFVTVANKDHQVCLNQGHDRSWTGWNC
jgi:hypothetical protein